MDFSRCSALRECAEKLVPSFKRELLKVFSSPPLSAFPVKTPMAPNQLQLQRLYEESEVLKGFAGPWYELSTYTVSLWTDSRFGGDSPSEENDLSEKYNKSNTMHADRVFIHVDVGLQIGIGKQGKYPEPTQDQYAAYKKAIGAAVQKAISTVVENYSGTLEDGTGYIKNVKGRE